VGKTSLAARYVHNRFQPDVQTTVGAAFMTKRLCVAGGAGADAALGLTRTRPGAGGTVCRNVDNLNVRLQIWDTAGQERYAAARRPRGAAGSRAHTDASTGLALHGQPRTRQVPGHRTGGAGGAVAAAPLHDL